MMVELIKKRLGERKGFTLIEVMIALVLFAVGMLAYMGLEVVSLRNMTYSRDYGRANTYAQQLIEQMKGKSYAEVSAGSDTIELRFTRTWTVTENTDKDVKSIVVTVSWVDSVFGNKMVTFFTDIYSPPVI
jgi:prepilin-type N-terminal cleavage/methylation domain-containing protein